MGLLTSTIILIGLAILTFRYFGMLRNFIPSWLATDQRQAPGPAEEHSANDPKDKEATEDGDSTPKAHASLVDTEVPRLALSSSDGSEQEEQHEVEPTVPSFPAANSAQRASAMPPPPRPNNASRNSGGLMPPPKLPSSLAPKPGATNALRVPTTGPLPNRGPPAGSQQRVSGGLSPNSAVKTPNGRGKVLLSPGHSPMDWAALTRKGNISGVSTFQRVTPSQLKQMTGRKGKPAWSSWQGKVYNITPYLPFHPGGEAELMKAAGRDGTKLFMDVHPWVNWENMLGSCLVGVMVPEDYGTSELEDMD